MNPNVQELVLNYFATNELLSRHLLASTDLDGNKDLDKACGYPDQITPELYRKMFDREGMGTRVVTLYPNATWSQWPEVYEVEDETKTEFELAWDQLAKDHQLYSLLNQADVASGIGCYGVILLGLDDGKDLDQPVAGVLDKVGEKAPEAATLKPRKLLYVRVFDEALAPVVEWDTNPKSYRYGLPTKYNLKFETSTPSANVSQRLYAEIPVHWTRVIHLADNRLTSTIVGTPRMQNVWNRLVDLRKTYGGGAEMFWRGGFPGLSVETHPGDEETVIDREAIRKEVEQMSRGLSRFMATMGVTVKSLAPQISSPKDHVGVCLQAIAIALECPLRKLIGSEEAKLAGQQDENSWDDKVVHRRCNYATPYLILPVVNRLVEMKVLPTPTEVQVCWPDIKQQSRKEIIEDGKGLIEALARYIQGGVDVVIPPLELLTKVFHYELEEAEAMLAAALQWIEDKGEEDDDPLPGEEDDPDFPADTEEVEEVEEEEVDTPAA